MTLGKWCYLSQYAGHPLSHMVITNNQEYFVVNYVFKLFHLHLFIEIFVLKVRDVCIALAHVMDGNAYVCHQQ